jgi:hypothetical protein
MPETRKRAEDGPAELFPPKNACHEKLLRRKQKDPIVDRRRTFPVRRFPENKP